MKAEKIQSRSFSQGAREDPDQRSLSRVLRSWTSHPFAILFPLLGVAALISLGVGGVSIPPGALLDVLWSRLAGLRISQPALATFGVILFELRLPRTILMALTGAALSGSGAAYQGLFRNPLADPYLIGVASGAGLGAVLAMMVRWPYTTLGLLSVPIAAFLSGLLTIFIVYLLARVGSSVPTTQLILAGVAVGSFATALTSFLMLESQGELQRALVWLLGGAAQSGWGPVVGMFPYVAAGLGALLLSGYTLNVLQFGDEQAQQLGLPVEKVRLIIILAASLSSAAAVSFSGIIGFVGLVAPHIIRLIWGSDYRRLLPLSILGGAIMLLLADVLARWVLAPQELPVGIITALVGAPFFLWVLQRAKRNGPRIEGKEE
ncbi:MAG: iron ABC transporter permease [Chloroflexi bacterium]|nr:iron ABC transporter permease [Chloroflexota bacterium]